MCYKWANEAKAGAGFSLVPQQGPVKRQTKYQASDSWSRDVSMKPSSEFTLSLLLCGDRIRNATTGSVWGKSMGSPDLGSKSSVYRLCNLGKPVMSLSFHFFIQRERHTQDKKRGRETGVYKERNEMVDTHNRLIPSGT